MIDSKNIRGLKGNSYFEFQCDNCGKNHKKLVSEIRRWMRRKKSDSITSFCSRKCSVLFAHSKRDIKYVEKVCEGCGKTFQIRDNKRGRVKRFCSRKCADRNRHTEEMREKLSNSAKKPQGIEGIDYEVKISASGRRRIIRLVIKECIVCGGNFRGTRNRKTCSEECYRENLRRIGKERVKAMTSDEFQHLVDRGKHGGYGHRTKAKCGIICRSKIEARILNFLTDLAIKFDYEPDIPETNKVADLLLKVNKKEYYIEIDGLCRGVKNTGFDWGEKLDHYQDLINRSVIDGFLVVTPSDFKKKFQKLLGV